MSWERSRRQRGFTMLEMVISITTLGIMAGAFIGTRSMIRSSKLSAVVKQVNAIRKAADTYVEANGLVHYGPLDTNGIETLIGARYLPSEINSTGNPFGITYATAAAGSDKTQLVITATNVPVSVQGRLKDRLDRYGTAIVISAGNKVQVTF